MQAPVQAGNGNCRNRWQQPKRQRKPRVSGNTTASRVQENRAIRQRQTAHILKSVPALRRIRTAVTILRRIQRAKTEKIRQIRMLRTRLWTPQDRAVLILRQAYPMTASRNVREKTLPTKNHRGLCRRSRLAAFRRRLCSSPRQNPLNYRSRKSPDQEDPGHRKDLLPYPVLSRAPGFRIPQFLRLDPWKRNSGPS